MDHISGRRPERQAQVVLLEILLLGVGEELARNRAVVRGIDHGDFDRARGARGLDGAHTSEVHTREAGRWQRHHEIAASLRTGGDRLAPDGLDLLPDEGGHGNHHDEGRILGRGDFSGCRIGRGGNGVRRRARSGILRIQLAIAYVIAVGVAQEHDVDVAKARIVRPGHRMPGVVQEPNPRGILEDRRAVPIAQLSGVRAERRDLHVLRRARGAGKSKGSE